MLEPSNAGTGTGTDTDIVLLVQSASGYWVRQAAQQVRAAGRRPVLITEPLTAAERERHAGDVEQIVELPTVTDPAALAAAARRFGPGVRLVTYSDLTVVCTAEAAELLGAARGRAAAVACARNKYAARRRLRASGLPGPRFALLSSAEDAAAVAADVGLPAVIKPVNGSGSNLVRAVHTAAELADAYRLLADRLPGTMSGLYDRAVRNGSQTIDPTGTFLVEGKLAGPEYCVDVVVRDGEPETLALFGKPLLDEVFFENIIATPPFDLDPDAEERLRTAAADAVLALGLDDTVAHVELIDDTHQGPTIIEVNPGRPGGGTLSAINELVTGIDPMAECLAAALGAPRPPRTEPVITVPVARLGYFGTGRRRLIRIHGLDTAEALPEVLAAVPMAEPGQLFSDDHEVFAVQLIVTGFFDAEDVKDLYEQCGKLIRLESEAVE